MLKLKPFLTKLHLRPKDMALYELAFTHPSVNQEKGIGKDYERLEFVGDGFINLIVAELVYRFKPDWEEGDMSKTRAKFVQTEGLFPLIEDLHLEQLIQIGPSITRETVAASKLIHEKVFEALVGAIYLDLGYKPARDFVASIFENAIRKVKQDEVTDFKTKLQEFVQGSTRGELKYDLVSTTGPSHQKEFLVHVVYDGIVLGEGRGSSKKIAEQNAAAVAIKKLARQEGKPNFKGKLQEVVQKKKLGTLVYEVASEEGPAHARTFVMVVKLNGAPIGEGSGAKKKDAEQAAAEKALKTIKA